MFLKNKFGGGKVMSIFRKIMDSKFMDAVEVIGDTTVDIIKGVAEVSYEVLTELFNHETTCSYNEKSNEDKTREYLNKLSYDEINDYYEYNEYLRRYGDRFKYSNKDQFIESICDIARRENRSFENKYDRY